MKLMGAVTDFWGGQRPSGDLSRLLRWRRVFHWDWFWRRDN